MQSNYKSFPKVYIIIVNWNGWKDTIECLESVYNNNYKNYQVVIVDNKSQNDSIYKIKQWANTDLKVDVTENNYFYFKDNNINNKFIPVVEYNYEEAINGGNIHKETESCVNLFSNIPPYPLVIIQSGRNLGFAYGNNIAIKYALAKQDLDYVWILNNDTIIDKNALCEMVTLSESNKKIGMVGSKLLHYYEPNIIQEIYGTVNWKDNGKGIGVGEEDNGQWDKNIEVNGRIMGASMLVTKDAIYEAGIFDEKYFMEYEETDWCVRIINLGWKIFYCYKSKVWHKEGGTITGSDNIRKKLLWKNIKQENYSRFTILRYYGTRNSIYLVNKFYKKYFPLFLLISVSQKLAQGIIKALLCREKKFQCIKLIFRSIYDGIRGNMGKTIDPQSGRNININKEKTITVLFVHNTAAHYRKDFFHLFAKRINTQYVFTKMNRSQKIYNVNIDMNNINKGNVKILKNYFGVALGLIPTLMMQDYEIVIPPTMDNIIECFESIITIIIAKIRRKKVVYFWEKWDVPSKYMPLKRKFKMKLKDMIAKPFINIADACIAPGKKTYDYFIKCGVKKEKIFIAPDASIVKNDSVYEDIRKKHNISQDKKIILYYGRIIKRKGLDILIRACKEIDNDNLYLLVCGDGEFKNYCESLAGKLNLSNICFAGFVKPEKRYIYFSQCDVFVLPSYFYDGEGEAWGLTLNEAMQFGKPVISTSAVGSAYDLIQSGENGYFIEQNSVDELQKAIVKIICNEKKMKYMGDASKNIINKSYSYTNMVNGFLNAVKFVLKI